MKIEKTITINATKESVWKVLTEDQYTSQWYAEFMEGSHAVGDWTEGSKIYFQDHSKSGMIAKINTNKPFELIEIEYTGWLENGEEKYDGPMADAVKGGKEIYRLEEAGGVTQLHAAADIGPEMYEEMNGLWDKAAIKLKALAEAI
ncbi:MAG: SRPBCC domain-containing protein [Sphingobacteriales bacterium JAD_PAG50586_3]|nr:MAG: SRPBCC domain-containing protein [Sphingobacteriales bacterium JAD_PAG50586_3]